MEFMSFEMKGSVPWCYRKVDDTFSITSHDLVKMLEESYNIDKNIEFTMESATYGKLAFLDFLVSANENKKLRTEFHKKTNA